MGIRLIGMTPAEVARTGYALDALQRFFPDEHAHVTQALQYIMMAPWSWGWPAPVRAYTGGPWGRGMMLAQRPTALSLVELAVCIAHEARHIELLADGRHRIRHHQFGARPPTPAERQSDPIYARDDEVHRGLSVGLAGENVNIAPVTLRSVWGAWTPPAPPSQRG